MNDRAIMHVDMDGFYAAVESLSHPEAKNRPMAVAGDPKSRHGIILAKNQLAKQAGVKTAEPIWQALSKCPGLLLLEPHHELYDEYCEKANAIYDRFTDRVEIAGIDESYLDVTGVPMLKGDGRELADEIRRAVRTELKVTVSVGVSFCKSFAKIGSDMNKPDGTTVITREGFKQMLYPLPATAMMSVGKVTDKALAEIGIRTIGQLAAVDEDVLLQKLGKQGPMLKKCAQGLDDEQVCRTEEQADAKSVGSGVTFRRDLETQEDVQIGLRSLSETVAHRLRAMNRKCRGVQVAIKSPDLKVIDRQVQLAKPTCLAIEIYEAALALLEKSWKIGKPIRLLSVTAINLIQEGEGEQLSLFDEGSQKREALERLLDNVKQKYGRSAVKSGAMLGSDLFSDE
ncbi:MAG: DNA polymerase IV [Clostridiales bacterium]|jgi:DNA polymerase-4|nr:DNA polymerase IV [Clostridiales bacterium]MDR2751051.1 DNA polymerase IV [Clostridiales bacterium]